MLAWPVGVHAVSGDRFHATWGRAGMGGPSVHLGCFSAREEAAASWDAEARRRGWKLVNKPDVAAGERSARLAIEGASAAAFPVVPTDAAWRARELAALHAAAEGGAAADARWASPTELRQGDHWTEPGNLLCCSHNPHIFETRKARSCAVGWRAQSPRPSAKEWWAASAANRARASRSVMERSGVPLGGGSPDAASAVRREACFVAGAWVLNFQPMVAAALYRRFAPQSRAVVYDPCGGWGGRLLGAAVAGNVRTYIACEPSPATHAGLTELSRLVATRYPHLEARIVRRGAEDTVLPPSSVDLAFTSPPYFNLEMYANETDDAAQSHVRFPEPMWWAEQFVRRLCEHCFAALRPGGALLLNVSNNRMLSTGGCELEQICAEHAAKAGFERGEALRMLKPRADASMADGSEPILLFRKPKSKPPPGQQPARLPAKRPRDCTGGGGVGGGAGSASGAGASSSATRTAADSLGALLGGW